MLHGSTVGRLRRFLKNGLVPYPSTRSHRCAANCPPSSLYFPVFPGEAEAAAKQAIQKGGSPDPSEAPMVLGQALTAEGKYDDAVVAFGQVKGGGPVTLRIARLWAGYVKIKKRG